MRLFWIHVNNDLLSIYSVYFQFWLKTFNFSHSIWFTLPWLSCGNLECGFNSWQSHTKDFKICMSLHTCQNMKHTENGLLVMIGWLGIKNIYLSCSTHKNVCYLYHNAQNICHRMFNNHILSINLYMTVKKIVASQWYDTVRCQVTKVFVPYHDT